MEVELKLNANDNSSAPTRIILTYNGKTMREMKIERPRLMIGRSEDNEPVSTAILSADVMLFSFDIAPQLS